MMRYILFICTMLIVTILILEADAQPPVPEIQRYDREPGFKHPVITESYTPKPFKPQQYVVYRTVDDIIIDGKIVESSWDNADWTERFGHIMFKGYRNPPLNTRAKMVWDDDNLYFAGVIEEPRVYAHITKNDTVVCHESDFEIFIDVDSDARNYVEIEFNAIGTIWDMIYAKELDKGALPKSWWWIPGSEPWDVEGMRLGVRVDGTLNYPYDVDEEWTFECSIPWSTLQQWSLNVEKLNKRGSSMRMNFSRVESVINDEWPIDTWESVSSVDWLWSPMLTYRAHGTECFGRVIMSDRTVIQYRDDELENSFPFIDPPRPPKKPKLGSMVKFNGGTYTIGPDDDDPSGASPKGEVTVNTFYMDCYEVTIGEYVRFLNAGPHDDFYWEDMADPDWCGIIKEENGKYKAVSGKDNYPVVLVAVEGAKAYAEWAGKRLPTEYEWEIAARGGTERLYPWGNEAPDVSKTNCDYHIGHALPVGSYPAGRTPEGLYDMAGNVNEIIDQDWEEYPWGIKRADEQKPCTLPLCRGGAWTAQHLKLKSTHRDVRKHFFKSPFTGFRCAKDAEL
ncbi:MAG: SUMF1/EgtB/PvdO family nonheme iron enzyme [Candidatus Latescibacteria bacterium]|nr:SUMF1/EgtB/PvdO family nonheme iron enzyme [Candidatus Latescibacterota bacterium]